MFQFSAKVVLAVFSRSFFEFVDKAFRGRCFDFKRLEMAFNIRESGMRPGRVTYL